MKRKLVIIGVVMALALTIIMPAAAVANGTVIALGEITWITEGETKAAGNSGRWIVFERDIEITFSGLINGPYTLTYHANVDTDAENLQAGNLQGVLISDDIYDDTVLNITATINPAELYVGPWDEPLYPGGPNISVGIYEAYIAGDWNFISGGVGDGTFGGYIYVVICADDYGVGVPVVGYDLDGHVLSVYPVGIPTIALYD